MYFKNTHVSVHFLFYTVINNLLYIFKNTLQLTILAYCMYTTTVMLGLKYTRAICTNLTLF